jgi:hypothetical protein
VLVFDTYVAGVANSPQIWALHFRGHSRHRVSLQHPSLLMAKSCWSHNCFPWFFLTGACTDCTPHQRSTVTELKQMKPNSSKTFNTDIIPFYLANCDETKIWTIQFLRCLYSRPMGSESVCYMITNSSKYK